MTRSPAPQGALGGLFLAAAVLIYPLAVYFALQTGHRGWVAPILLGLMVPAAVFRLRRIERRALRSLAPGPLLAVAVVAIGLVRDDIRYMLAIPALVNLVLLGSFAASLRRGERSVVEHLARAQIPEREFGAVHVRYCRSVTITWCVFFVVNGLAAALLAAFAPYSWWAIGTGLLSYVALGLLFTIEYVVRKYRFRLYGQGWHDRAFAKLFPPHSEGPRI